MSKVEMRTNINFEKDSELLKALGHPVRLRIACGLMCGDGCNVNKIVENLRMPQSTVSQHLAVLRNHGVITYRKEGVKTCYSVCDDRVRRIVEILDQA